MCEQEQYQQKTKNQLREIHIYVNVVHFHKIFTKNWHSPIDSANKRVYNITRTKEENKRRTRRSEKISEVKVL